jgi:hypothetical protein
VLKNPTGRVVPLDTFGGTNPHIPRMILEKRHDIYGADTVRILRIVNERSELIPVITQQTVVCTKPKESLIVLYYSIHDTAA